MTNNPNQSESVPGGNERFEEIGQGCYAYSADGFSNTGVVIGERGVLIIDGQATPEHAGRVLKKVRALTDKPVKQIVLTHFHADNTLGAPAFEPGEILASDLTRRMMDTRGPEDILLSKERSPALFSSLPAAATVSLPSMTIASSMSIDLGGIEVRLMHLGRAHTMGDVVVWVPASSVIFAGDLVQTSAIPYCGDAHLTDWPRALDRITAFRPTALVPGRGRSAKGTAAVAQAVETTRDFVTTLRDAAAACVEQSLGLKDTFDSVKDALAPQFGSKADFEMHLPFNVARAYDEALGLDQPQIWTRERCADLRDALGGVVVAHLPQETVAEPSVEEMHEAVQAQLVSDNEFAASLADDPDAQTSGDGETLDLSSEDIVDTTPDDQAPTAPENEETVAEEPEILLEGVR
ncbi:MBL fold metallo-hydrolase [Roseibium sp. MMSF_3544]|uniref:MBL fold metallo-hydrolase n=1 Tax=unclassified Roseibium TaxID=2629323 RepID=UPI00273D99C8|nr:MBL fold metallo-hydrolase [Roseibium sp. MMSF_3544]